MERFKLIRDDRGFNKYKNSIIYNTLNLNFLLDPSSVATAPLPQRINLLSCSKRNKRKTIYIYIYIYI